MSFDLPPYRHPDFNSDLFKIAPNANYVMVEKNGVVPDNFHSTSMFPEYCKIDGKWILAEESRMDSCIVVNNGNSLSVVENRNVKIGNKVIVGRSEKAEEGIFVWPDGFKTL
jgi:hypothetical protein